MFRNHLNSVSLSSVPSPLPVEPWGCSGNYHLALELHLHLLDAVSLLGLVVGDVAQELVHLVVVGAVVAVGTFCFLQGLCSVGGMGSASVLSHLLGLLQTPLNPTRFPCSPGSEPEFFSQHLCCKRTLSLFSQLFSRVSNLTLFLLRPPWKPFCTSSFPGRCCTSSNSSIDPTPQQISLLSCPGVSPVVDLLAEVVEALVELVELCLLALDVGAVLLELAGQGVGARLGPLQVLLCFTQQELLGLELGAHGLWGKKKKNQDFLGFHTGQAFVPAVINSSHSTGAAGLSCSNATSCGKKKKKTS